MKGLKKFGLILSAGVMTAVIGVGLAACGPKLDASETSEHDLVLHAATEATCLAAGSRAYYQCADCDKYFSDRDAINEIAADKLEAWATIPQLKHKSGGAYYYAANDPKCDQAGNVAYYICTNGCGQFFEDIECKKWWPENNVYLNKTAHNAVAVVAKDPTCEADGNIEYYQCTNCHQTFEDAECKFVKGNVAIKGGHQTNASHYVPYQRATCLADGHLAHYTCLTCDKTFSDVDCKNEITDVVLPQLTHESDHPYHVQYRAATCENNGTLEYWECMNGCAQKFLTRDCDTLLTENPVLPALGHYFVIDKDISNQISAARREIGEVDEDGNIVNVVSTQAKYYQVCTHEGCNVHDEKRYAPLSGFTTLTGDGHTYESDEGMVVDVLTLDASALVERDGKYCADTKIKVPGTYHAGSQYKVRNQDGVTTVVENMAAEVYNSAITLTVRLDKFPQYNQYLTWSFDWDGDGKYEQIIKVRIIA